MLIRVIALVCLIVSTAFAQLPVDGGGGGGTGTAAPPIAVPFSAVTTITSLVTAPGRSINDVPDKCLDNGTPAATVALTAGYPQKAANGDITWAWTGSKTGNCYVISGSASGAAGGALSGSYPNPGLNTVGVGTGGTGKSSWTQYAIPYASAPTVITEIPIGAAGQCLQVNGTTNGYAWGACGSGGGSWGSITGTLSSQTDLNTALGLKEATANKGAAGGYASLDGSTKIPIAQVPTGTSGTTVALGNHGHAAADVTSGTFADARIASSNVTQHQALLAIAATQLTSGVLPDARVQQSNVTQHQGALAIAATQLTSGILPAARLPLPTISTLGGVMAKTCTSTDKLSAIGTDGIPVCSADTGGSGGSSVGKAFTTAQYWVYPYAEHGIASCDAAITVTISGDIQTPLRARCAPGVETVDGQSLVQYDRLVSWNSPQSGRMTVTSGGTVTGGLLAANNLSDLVTPATALTNLGAAPAAKGVTNGDTHDHNGGDGAQIAHSSLSGIGTNTHAQIDTAITNSVAHIASTSNPHSTTAAQIGASIPALTADASPDAANDYVITYDTSATSPKKVLLQNLPSSGASTGAANTFTRGQVIDGTADENQLRVQGNATQTTPIFVVEKSDGTDILVVNNDGSVQMGAGSGPELVTCQSAPSTPSAGTGARWFDCTDKTLKVKDDAGNVSTTVRADTGAANNFVTAISAAGVISKAQPAFSNLSGSVASTQMPALTGDVTSSAGSVATTVGKINGVSMAGLATGILKNTTGTGAPSIAAAADLPAHASRHQNGGNDEIATATAGANAIPKAGAGGQLAAGWMPAYTGDVTSSAGATANTLLAKYRTRAIPFSIGDPGGSALSAASTTTYYQPVPFACTISAYTLLADAGTFTVKFWKVAAGTAIPTSANSINTSGVSLSSGTVVRSTTLTDFTTTAVAANDILAMNVTTTATAKFVQGTLECVQ